MPCRMGASFARAPRPRNPQRFSSEHGSTLTRILTRAHTHTHTHTKYVCTNAASTGSAAGIGCATPRPSALSKNFAKP